LTQRHQKKFVYPRNSLYLLMRRFVYRPVIRCTMRRYAIFNKLLLMRRFVYPRNSLYLLMRRFVNRPVIRCTMRRYAIFNKLIAGKISKLLPLFSFL